MTDNAKKKGLRGQKRYYYVFSIGTEYEHRGKGQHSVFPDFVAANWLTQVQVSRKRSCGITRV